MTDPVEQKKGVKNSMNAIWDAEAAAAALVVSVTSGENWIDS